MLGIAGAGMRWPMRLGGALVALDRYGMPGRLYPAEADAADACFQHLALVTDDAQAAWDRALLAGAMPIGTGDPVTLPPSSGGVTAMKFRDPEGHPLELLHFPNAAKKGWHGTGLLGIDHSAIVVRDLGASEAFYTAYGLKRGDVSLNRGQEQAMLDGLDDPVVDVVPMMPHTAPPHVELLHYRRPIEAPADAVAVNDVAATRIVWHGGAPALLRDPDGHLHQTGG